MTLEEFEQKYKLTTFIPRRKHDWKENRLTEFNKWERASADVDIPEEAIEKYFSKLEWDEINYEKFAKNLNFVYKWKEFIKWKHFAPFFVKAQSEEVVREFADYIFEDKNHSTKISWNTNIDWVREWKDKYDWIFGLEVDKDTESIFNNTKYTDEFEKDIMEKLEKESPKNGHHVYFLWEHFKFSSKFIEKHRHYGSNVRLNTLIENDNITEEYFDKFIFTEENQKRKEWEQWVNFIFTHSTISTDLIKKKINYIKDVKNVWNTICRYQKLDEDFIDQFKDFVNWSLICKHQDISEEFIEKHSQYINKFWNLIIDKKQLSDKFIEQHWNEFNTFTKNKINKSKEKIWNS